MKFIIADLHTIWLKKLTTNMGYKYIISVGVTILILFTACDVKFQENTVYLEIGDDFQKANDENPAGTTFILESGGHYLQSVKDPRPGTSWIGEDGAIMDGFDETGEAFRGDAKHVTIHNISFRNYVDNAINFRHGKNIVIDRVQITDTGSGDGNDNGAIRVAYVQGFTVTNSHFERVSAGILPTKLRGPVIIERNTALNIGRNFVQLDKVKGKQIRIRFNTMERNENELRKGAEDVEDWISVFKTEGLPNDPAQISYNRARGHGTSQSGAFIILGDGGGKYLVAEGNVGVRPGQVGIGIAGGRNIRVNDNIMYSSDSLVSNVAYYSANFSDEHPCEYHTIQNNRSNWKTGLTQNNFWTDNACGVKSVGNIFPDFTINENVWLKAEKTIQYRADLAYSTETGRD